MGASERQQKEDWIGGGRKIGSVAGAAEGKSKTNLALISAFLRAGRSRPSSPPSRREGRPRGGPDLLPSFVAAVAPGGPAAGWRGACFAENQAVLNLTQAAAGGCNATAAGLLGGAVLSIKGDEIISMVPWDEWWGKALRDDSNPQIALLPLHPDVRARFNETAAWEFARSMYGKPYGYHNMIFSWIDTMSDNYPPPLDGNLVMAIMSMWTRLQPHYASNMLNEALNKRLGTEKLDLCGIITETEKRGMSFNQLLTIPEQDDWEYSDGKSTTCVAFILSMYKAAGVFAPFTDSIQVTEFTIRDAYMLKIFEDNQTRLPSWCNTAADELPFCQILGEYKMALPEYNTIEPYANMNENCPSSPPIYARPSRC